MDLSDIKVPRICSKCGYKRYILTNFLGNTSGRNIKYLILMTEKLHTIYCLEFIAGFWYFSNIFSCYFFIFWMWELTSVVAHFMETSHQELTKPSHLTIKKILITPIIRQTMYCIIKQWEQFSTKSEQRFFMR